MLMTLEQCESVDRRGEYLNEWLAGAIKKFPYLLTASENQRTAHRDAEIAGTATRRWIKEAEAITDKRRRGILQMDPPYDPVQFARISARQAAHLAFIAKPDLRSLGVTI